MKFDTSRWNYRTILIELLILAAGLGSVFAYNTLFQDSISPMMGVVVGAINASLVGWCIHANRHGKVESNAAANDENYHE